VSSDEDSESDFSDDSESYSYAKLVEEVESYGPDLIKDEEDRK